MSMPSSSALVAASPSSSPERRACLDRAPLLGEVAAAVGRDPAGQRRVDLGEQVGRGQRHLLDPAPGAHERQGAHVLGDQVGEQVGGLGGGGAADRRAVLAGVRRERRLPQRQRHLAARRGVAGDRQHVEPGQPAGRELGLGDGGRGQDERRGGAVGGADPAQPAQDVGDVGAEDAAVVVALVDHDVAAASPGTPPSAAWPGSSERCSMSGLVRTYSAWSRAQSRCSRLLSPSWVVTRTSSPSDADRGQLVLGQRLGGREVEDGGAAPVADVALLADRGQRRQLVGQRLAGGRAGGEHDVLTRVGGLRGRRLVLPGPVDPAPRRRRRRRRAPPRSGQSACTAARGGSTSRWVSRSSRPGTAASRSTTRPSPEGRSRTVDVTRRVCQRPPTGAGSRDRALLVCASTGRSAWLHIPGRCRSRSDGWHRPDRTACWESSWT